MVEGLQQGVCSGCGHMVQLVYEHSNPKGRLVVSRHEPPPQGGKPEDYLNRSCSGSGRLPKETMTAQK